MVKSFFDPGWMDLGILGVYGRWGDVNWVWSEWLTIYHAIFSIVIPITLVELTYPDMRNKPWLSNRKLVGITVLLCAVTAFGYGFLTPYRPPVLQYLLSVILVGALFLLAWKLPSKTGKKGQVKPWASSRLTLFGFFVSLTFFLLFGAGPHIIAQPPLLMLLGIILVFTIFSVLKRYAWTERNLYHKFALTAGALGFFIILTPLQELDTSRLDNTRGMLLVGIITTVMLLLLRKKLKSHLTSLDKKDRCCRNCGIEIPNNAKFCPNCGIEITR